MDSKTVVLILDIAERFGIPAVKMAIDHLGKSTLTLADLADLRALVKEPEKYFEDGK